MKIISIPPTGPRRPRPPRKKAFIAPGTIAENEGVHWVLKQDSDQYGSWKWWERL